MNKFTLFGLLAINILGILFLSFLLAFSIHLIGKPFLPSFLFSLAVVIILGLFHNSFMRIKNESANRELEYETAKLISSTTLKVSCAYCRAENLQFIDLDNEMIFNCVSCKQPNKVAFNYGAVRITTPLNTDLDLGSILPEDENRKEDI